MTVTRFLHLSNQNSYTVHPDVTKTSKPWLEKRKTKRCGNHIPSGFSCTENKPNPVPQVSFAKTACKQQSEPFRSSFRTNINIKKKNKLVGFLRNIIKYFRHIFPILAHVDVVPLDCIEFHLEFHNICSLRPVTH